MKKANFKICRICGKRTGNTNVCDDCFFPMTRRDYFKFLYGGKR